MNKIILALDTPDARQALKITKKVKDKIYTIKIGSEFYFRFGKEGVKKFNDIGINNIFLDLKIHDIGNTVHKAILALKDINFKYLSVHSLGGNEAIKKAKTTAKEINPNLKILAVTVLTSINEAELKKMGVNSKVEDLVLSLAKNSSDADGFIASGAEAKMLRENFPKHILFTPGVRLPGDNRHDQKRVVTPAESLKFSDKVIMGRSLLQGDVGKNLEKVLNSIK